MQRPTELNLRKRFLAVAGVLLGVAAIVGAQQPQKAAVSLPELPAQSRAEISELAKHNDELVAASSFVIRSVLQSDPGLMVELKRWIAEEATNNGQTVDDRSLTETAMFDRLDTDLKFRAAATRLLQLYGYLQPKMNPGSDAAKEHDAFTQARLEHRLQMESESQERSVQARQAGPVAPARRKEASPPAPVQTVPRPSSEAVITTESRPQAAPSGGMTLISNPASEVSPLAQPGSTPHSMGAAGSPGSAAEFSFPNLDVVPDLNSATALPASRNEESQPGLLRASGGQLASAGDATPVAMLHRPNPYAGIPSLYDLYVQAAWNSPVKRFGTEVFQDGLRDPRAIPMDLPVGSDYVVGPGDTLAIDLWGGISTKLVRTVDRDGRVTLPEAGPLLVSGRSLGDVQQAVQRAVSTQFRGTSADVSVSRLRTVRVYIVGEVQEPGAYDISSLSTALNAMVAAGGVTPRGSLRELKHYRGRQLLENVDTYDLLLRGVKPDAQKLENGDTLVAPPIGPQVTVTGMVRRPAVYELNGEKTLADVLALAGGILPAAALKHVEVQRVDAHEKRTMLSLDLSADNGNGNAGALTAFEIRDGDQIHIFPIAPYNQDAVYLQGHVLRPGRYSYQKGLKLSDLISSYKDLLPEPAAHYAEIVRLDAPDFRPRVEGFDLAAALADPAAAPELEPLDTVRIFGRFDFEPPPTVWVGGEVRNPGNYITSGQAHLRDAVFMAGGFTPDASFKDAQLFRREADGNEKIMSVNLGAALAGNALDNILLEPRDRLLIHKNFERVEPPTVNIRGEVANPGRYPLTSNMRVEDLVRVAGGLKRSADTGKADLTRYPLGSQPGEQLEVSLASIAAGNPGEDLPLHNGDVLTIRQVPGWTDLGASVTLRGEVQHPGSYGIRPGEKLSAILERAGGYTPEAYPYGAVMMRGSVRETEDLQRAELIRRVEAQQANIRLLPETDQDQKNAKISAIAQTQASLDQLRLTPPVGRLVIHIQGPIETWRNTAADVALRDGDVLAVPKKIGYVMVSGQVFNPTAVSYRNARSAKWYLGQAGGVTQLADKKGVFVIRADGSVISARNQSSWWAGDPLKAELRPGDTVVVPEKALNIGNKNWTALLQAAQAASSIALALAAVHP